MKIFTMFLISFCSVFSQPISWTDITSNYSSLPNGVKLFKGERSSPILVAYYLDVDLNNPDIAVRPYITTQTATVPVLTERFGAFAAINGGFFSGTTSLSTVVYPNEVKAQNVSSLTRNSKSYPVIRSFFGVNKDRSMSVDWIYHFGNDVEDIYSYTDPLPYSNNDPNPLPPPQQSGGTPLQNLLVGIGGAPTLVKNGQPSITYNEEIMWGSGVGLDNNDPRTGIGYTADNHIILFVADGRSVTSEGVSLTEMAQIFINLGCVEAMNLDGGGSTQMAVGNQFVNLSSTRSLPVIFAVVDSDSLQIPQDPTFEKIIDTGDDGASLIGTGWFASANAGYYGNTPAQLNAIGDGSNYALFKPDFPKPAKYEVYGWWVASSNRANDTPFIIKHKNGTDTVKVNQAANGSMWNLIGEYDFNADTTDEIIISNAATTGSFVVADAVRFVSYDSSLTSVNYSETIPSDFKLFQNYPNPFNPYTVIKYALSSTQFAILKVYDILGNEISTLVNEEKNPGVYEVYFDASGFSSGIYFYKLQTGSFTETRKMVLIK